MSPLPEVTISAGTPVQLVCNVSGIPLPEVSWTIPTRNGTQIIRQSIDYLMVEEDRSLGHVGLITSTLTISQVNVSGDGQYSCVAENNLGNDTGQASVNVYG